MRILFALLLVLIGAIVLLRGFRLARFIIPLWGFLAGLSVGGAVISDMSSTPFLGTFLGIIVGLGLGLLFGIFAYLYYAVAVVVLAGAFGYWLGSSFILLLGLHAGLVSMLVGLSLGIIVGFFALFYNAPKYFLIILTSLSGAMAMVGGVLLLFNVVPLEDFNYAAVHTFLDNSFIWSLIALALAIGGYIVQVRTTIGYGFDKWTYGDHDRGAGHTLPPSPMAHQH